MRGILFLSESSLKSSRTTSATIHYSNKPFVVKCHSVRLSTRLTYRQWCQQDQSQISRSLASTYYRRKRVIASQRIRTSPSQFKLLAKARQTAYQSTAACSERYGKYFVSKVCVQGFSQLTTEGGGTARFLTPLQHRQQTKNSRMKHNISFFKTLHGHITIYY